MQSKFRITRMMNVDWKNGDGSKSIVEAVLNLETPCGIVIRDCQLKNGQYGWFVSSPSKKLREPYVTDAGVTKEFIDICFIPKEVQKEIDELAAVTYDPGAEVYVPYSVVDFSSNNTAAPTQAAESTSFGAM